MRVTVTVFPADQNQFVVSVGDVPLLASADESSTEEGSTLSGPALEDSSSRT